MPTTGSVIEQRHLDVLREIRQPILFALNRCFRNAFVGVVDSLVEQIVSETSWERQDQLNASLDLLRNGKISIEKQFEQACAQNWHRRTGVDADGSYSTPQAQLLADEPPTLRLVDDDTVRDQLQVSRISARSRRRMDEELTDGLRARFGVLLDQEWFAEDEYPIAPDIIFEMLREIFAGHQGTRGTHVATFLLDQFEPKLSIELIELYQEVNRRLLSYGILPSLRYSIAKSRATALINSAAEMTPEEAERQWGSRAGGQGGGEFSGGYGMAQVSDADISRWADHVASQDDPVAMASATRYLSDPRNFGVDGEVTAHRQATSDQLMAVLNELQNRTREANEDEDVGALIEDMRAQTAEAAQAHGSPLDRLIIQTVAQVFQHVYADEAIANAIKQQLLRLQVAAFKAALIDPSFFARPDHPMRRFVDRLAEIGSEPDFETEPGSPLVQDTEALVTWVLDNFERELVVIGEALDRAEKVVADEIARRDARLEKIAEAASRAERIDALRQEIRRAMQQKTQRAEVPEEISRFVLTHWVEVIMRLREESGERPFDESRAQRTIDTLLWSVAPKKASEIGELARQIPQLIADLSRGMAFIAMSSAEREGFLRELMAAHGRVIEQSKQRAADVAAAAPAPVAVPVRPGLAGQVAMPAKPGAGGMQAAGSTAAGVPLHAGMHRGASAASASLASGASPRAESGMGASMAMNGRNDDVETPALRGGVANLAPLPEGVEDRAWDPVSQAALKNGDEVERVEEGADGGPPVLKRYRLGWVSPSASVFIFSRYPSEHWTANRADLNDLLRTQKLTVIRKESRVGQVLNAMASTV